MFVVQDLHALKYTELQKLAKSVGIRANQKVEKLIIALTNHYVESEAVEKEQSSSKKQATPLQRSKKNALAFSQRLSSSVPKPSPSLPAKALVEKNSDEVKTQTPVQRGSRKRRRTYELEEASLQGGTPTIDGETEKQTKRPSSQRSENGSENVTKRLRRSTSNKDLASSKSNNISLESLGSPGTKAIIEAMDADCSNSERRRRLLSLINNKVQQTVSSTTSTASSKSSQPSQIPRFTTFVLNKKQESQKSVTPGNKNWKKIHKKEFSKFDSIDVYLDKRKQRQDELSSSVKKLLPFGSPAGRAKPTIVKPVSKKAGAKIFQPQITSVRNISFNFNKAPSSTSKTPSKHLVTPARGLTPAASCKSSKQADSHNKATTGKGTTPFKFTGNSTFLKQAAPAKSTFDLKASLARPMTWKPHTGKLEPVDTNKVQPVQTQRQRGPIAHRTLASKTRAAKVKKVQRTAVLDHRSNQKYIDMMKKRGLLA